MMSSISYLLWYAVDRTFAGLNHFLPHRDLRGGMGVVRAIDPTYVLSPILILSSVK